MSLHPRPGVENIEVCPHGGANYAELRKNHEDLKKEIKRIERKSDQQFKLVFKALDEIFKPSHKYKKIT